MTTSGYHQHQSRNIRRLLYLDTDTTFTAYLTAGLVLRHHNTSKENKLHSSISNPETARSKISCMRKHKKDFIDEHNNGPNHTIDKRLVQVFLPSEGRFESILGELISTMPEASIVIFDSLNSFYNMYPIISSESFQTPRIFEPSLPADSNNPRYTISRLNHLLSIFVMLLVEHGIYHKVPVLVTSMVRYKKVSEDLWIKSAACRRLLQQKSIVRLSVEMRNENDLLVNVMQHPSLLPQTFEFPNAGIYSAFEID